MDDFFTPLVLKIDIYIRRLIALAADETLKQHVHARRVHLRHPQAVTHRRIRRRTAPLAEDVAVAGEGHDVMHRQKIHLVLQLGNERQLVFDLQLHRGGNALWVTLACALVGVLAQRLLRREAIGNRLHRVLVTQLIKTEGAARGDGECVRQKLRRVNLPDTLARTQMRLGVGLQLKPALGHRHTQTHRGDHVLQRFARTHMHVHVASGHQRHAGAGRQVLQRVLPQGVVQMVQQLQNQPEI